MPIWFFPATPSRPRGESIQAAEFKLYSGGRGANSAVAAARAGCQVTFVGAHGADLFGRIARDGFGGPGRTALPHAIRQPRSNPPYLPQSDLTTPVFAESLPLRAEDS